MDKQDLRSRVGDEPDDIELETLLRADELLRSVQEPPEVSRELDAAILAIPTSHEQPAPPQRRRDRLKNRRVGVYAVAATLAGIAFAIGWLARGGGEDRPGPADVVTLEATRFASGEPSMVLDVFPVDEGGNWVMLADIEGLEPAGADQHYELWLTQDGRVTASCGRFLVDETGKAENLWFNAPYRFIEYDDWVVTLEGPGDQRSRVLMRAAVTTRAS